MRQLARVLTLSLILLAPLAACHSPSSESHERRVVDQLIADYAEANAADYRLFNRPTQPPEDADSLEPVPEYAPAAALVTVYDRRRFCVEMIRAAAKHVPVCVLAPDASQLDEAVKAFADKGLQDYLRTGRIQLVTAPVDSIWVRDYGPVFVRRSKGAAPDSSSGYYLVDSIYSSHHPGVQRRELDDLAPHVFAELFGARSIRPPLCLSGGNFAVDGNGICFTTSETVADNGGDAYAVRAILKCYFGCKDVVFLEPIPGPTVKHVDMFFRVAGPQTYLLGKYDRCTNINSADAYFQDAAARAMEANRVTIEAALKRHGIDGRIIRVPMPSVQHIRLDQSIDRSELANALGARSDGEDPDWSDLLDGDGADLFARRLFRSVPLRFSTYLNYVHIRSTENSKDADVLLVPDYPGDLRSRLARAGALRALREAYPGADIELVDCSSLIDGQGALHCVTIVVPTGIGSAFLSKLEPVVPPRPEGAASTLVAQWPTGEMVTIDDVRTELGRAKAINASHQKDNQSADWRDALVWRSTANKVIERRGLEVAMKQLGVKFDDDELHAKAQSIAGPEWMRDSKRAAYGIEAWDSLARDRLLTETNPVSEVSEDELQWAYLKQAYVPGRLQMIVARVRHAAASEPPKGSAASDADVDEQLEPSDLRTATEGAQGEARSSGMTIIDDGLQALRQVLAEVAYTNEAIATLRGRRFGNWEIHQLEIQDTDPDKMSGIPYAWQEVIDDMEDGEVSGLLRRGSDRFVVKVFERKESSQRDLTDQEKRTIYDQIRERKRQKAFEDAIEDLLKDVVRFDAALTPPEK